MLRGDRMGSISRQETQRPLSKQVGRSTRGVGTLDDAAVRSSVSRGWRLNAPDDPLAGEKV